MGSYAPTVSDDALRLKMPEAREFLGGDLLAQSIAALGCDVAFGLHGGHLDAFLTGCSDANIRLIDTRHETVAVQAAEGYAKISGKVGVCFVTANSGSPIFCITSSPPLRDAETNCLQGFHDQVVLAKPITKFAHRVTNVEEIPRIVSYAWRTAVAGAPGPVLIDFPIDILFSPPRLESIAWGAINRPLPYAPAPAPEAVDEALQLWTQAKRPVLLTGTGARGKDFANQFLKLAEMTNTPVFYSSKYGSVIPYGHKLRGGPASRLALLPMIKEQSPDLMILLGARTGFLLGGRSGAILPNSGCKFIQVDTDGGEIGKSHAIDCGIVSSSQQFVHAMLSAISRTNNFASSEGWIQTASSLKDIPGAADNEPEELNSGRLHPVHAYRELFKSLPAGAIVCIDGGEVGQWSLELLEHSRASLAMVATGYLGFLGNGWGYALGAAVAEPSKLVLNLHGDGSAGFHLQELDTYARFSLNILTVIGNNYAWGMSQAGQDLLYGETVSARQASKLSPHAEYETVAAGLQCASARVDKIADIRGAVDNLLKAGKPGLLNLIVSDKPIHAVTKSMLNVDVGKNWIVVPYYDNIPRPHYEI
ncbi:hypothetical protein LTR64_001995 [Lithohypha guttulata]|uniref:uncharacterized protein n=1 Tax=Lithohypha guttulata TaxID=1690604 RepID=UPI002DDE9159|nr:hypothetical protein LTR51_007854 [Lithohypha guttulata]